MSENKKRDIVRGDSIGKLTVRVEPPPPPPLPGFISPFKTLQEWLFHICDNNPPENFIAEYQFSIVETLDNNMISLFGFNTYNTSHGTIDIHIEYKPVNAFFPLPKAEYGNLTKELLHERLLNELKEFTKTTKFQNSFLSKAQTISTNFAKKFWPS